MANTKTTKTGNANMSNGGSEATAHPQLEKLFMDQLKDIYWAEKHLTKALPKMKKAATTGELQQALETHLNETLEQVTRLEQVFGLFDHKPQAKKCDAMEGLIKEGDSIVEETEDGTMTRDAGIIMASQKIEHYEIATYGTLVQFSKTMGRDDVAEILNSILDEEKGADETLTGIAENNINWEAELETGSE
ncbi:MAG TPA: ferritin-like domain-containing protein [Chitinophagaceae bacterium]|nr:ferritin-like domain-containing protein [Chitinophagaceae bacterium]